MQATVDSNKLSNSDDEEDLEALRIAALQSLKRKNAALNGASQIHNNYNSLGNFDKSIRYGRSMKGMQNKRGRFFGPHQGRGGNNGHQFNNRVRNSNLIAIPTIPSDDDIVENIKVNNAELTLTLPQDRYCSKDGKDDKVGEGISKFNRYNNSDKSETESEEEEGESSEGDSPGKLEKSDSLEALMQELDDEIQGKTKVKEEKPEKPKTKKTKRKKRVTSESINIPESNLKNTVQKVESPDCNKNVEVIKHNETSPSNNSNVTMENSEIRNNEMTQKLPKKENRRRYDERDNFSPISKRFRHRSRSGSPVNRRGFLNRRRPRAYQPNFSNLPMNMPFVPISTQYPPPIIPFPPNPFIGAPNLDMMHRPPPFFDRPLSPLAINTESLQTATLAPLSPRSAAFVLQNKAIIEKRKRSPRRSYSRSSSRSPRRSLTPRRSPRRSMSPRRMSRSPRRLSRSPVRRRSLSPRRRSVSPRRRNVGKSTNTSPKSRQPVRQRLGHKNKTEEGKEKDIPKESEDKPPKEEEKPMDPVLEARKKKFESNEIKMKEGIIRLKPKEEKVQEAPLAVKIEVTEEKTKETENKQEKVQNEIKELDPIEELENLLLGDDIILDHKVDDIFSDEDSASDNEGRFKVKQQSGQKPSILPFTKLVNSTKKEIKSETLPDSRKSDRDRRRDRRSNSNRSRGRSPLDTKSTIKEEVNDDKKTSSKTNETPSKKRVTSKSDRPAPQLERRFERKIEIKIKNPAKYERGGKLKFSKDGEKVSEKVLRKVELGIKEEPIDEEEDLEPEIVVENDSGDEENSNFNEGDLRAQLSKKRAEKLHRIPIEGVSSRLLQNALQGAVFKKAKRKSKEQDITTSDGKLPIHLRLGIANNSDIFIDTKVKRKSRKRKNREVLEQV